MRTLRFLLSSSVFFIAACLFLVSPLSAQITFQKTFGGTDEDIGNSIRQTTDGGYIIVGNTYSFGVGENDIYLIKTDSNGDSLWTKIFGGMAWDYGYSVQQTTDGGYIIAGHSFRFLNYDVYLIKTNANGDILWTKASGGINYDRSFSIQQTTDGGYIIAGYTDSFGATTIDVYLIRTDANGDTIWTKTFGGMGADYGNSVQQTADGGYIIAGRTNSFGVGDYDAYLIKTDSNGDSVWSKTFGGIFYDVVNSAQQTTDGGYIITGSTVSFGTSMDVYLIKTDVNGDTLWTKTFGGTYYDYGNSVQQTSDGGYIIIGRISISGGNNDVYIIKTDVDGNSLWTKNFGGITNEDGNSVQQAADGGYIITGQTASFGAGDYDVYLIKADTNGNSGCNQGNPATVVSSTATQVTSPPTIVGSGGTVTVPPTIVGSDGTVTTLCLTVGINQISNFQFPISISPNPSPGNFTITFPEVINKGEVQIFNAYGSKVFSQNIHNTSNTEIHLKHIPEGIYFVKVWDGEKEYCEKLMIE